MRKGKKRHVSSGIADQVLDGAQWEVFVRTTNGSASEAFFPPSSLSFPDHGNIRVR